VIVPVIVAVHVHGNDTVIVIVPDPLTRAGARSIRVCVGALLLAISDDVDVGCCITTVGVVATTALDGREKIGRQRRVGA